MVITHVNSEVTCIVEGILRGKIVAYRAPIDHIRPYYDIHLENIPAMKRDEDIEEEEETEKDKRKRGRGEEGEDWGGPGRILQEGEDWGGMRRILEERGERRKISIIKICPFFDNVMIHINKTWGGLH